MVKYCVIWMLFAFTFLPITYGSIWSQQALDLQSYIDIDAPLNQATIIGTHNSYNSKAYQIPVLRYVDPNQSLSLFKQLEAGARSIELDAHWFYKKNFKKDILLCHGQSNHAGCSMYDRPFTDGLKEIRDWVVTHPYQLILLYIEKHVDGHENQMANQIESILGPYILKSGRFAKNYGSCTALPTHLSKRDILNTGKQIIVVTKGCQDNKAEPWKDLLFAGIGDILNSPFTFIDMTIAHFNKYPSCEDHTNFQRDSTHNSLWRVYEDRTQLNSVIHPERKLLNDDMRDLIHCGINWPTVDFLSLNDGRMDAAIWSWSDNYPQQGKGNCAYLDTSGIKNTDCQQSLMGYVCREEGTQNFKLSTKIGKWATGEMACNAFGHNWHFSLAQNGKQAYNLRELIKEKNLATVWLNYSIDQNGEWMPHTQSRNLNG